MKGKISEQEINKVLEEINPESDNYILDKNEQLKEWKPEDKPTMSDFKQLSEKLMSGIKESDIIEESKEPNKEVELLRSKIVKRFGKKFLRCSLKGFELYEGKEYEEERLNQIEVLRKCKEFQANLTSYNAIVFSGLTRTGKTHLATAISKSFTGSMKVTTFEDICEEKVVAQKDGKKWQSALRKYVVSDVLLMDDFCIRGTLSDSQRDVLYYILNEMSKNEKTLIMTTNLTPQQVINVIDGEHKRNYSRLFEMTEGMTNFLTLDWTPFYKYKGKDFFKGGPK